MPEARIIRFSELLDQGGRELEEARFDRVRRACRGLVDKISPHCRPTLVLLDHKDIKGGVLEALLELSGPAIGLPAKILATADPEPAFMLAICIPQPALEAWDGQAKEEDEEKAQEAIKDNEFFIRLFENYRLAIVIRNVSLTTTPPPESCEKRDDPLIATIARNLEALEHNSRGMNWCSRLRELREDIQRLAECARDVLGNDQVARYFMPNQPDRFLRILLRLDQFGKRPIEHIQKGIRADVACGLEILEKYPDGSHGLRQQLNEALRRGESFDGQIRELARDLQGYQFFRDCARCLGDGVFPWARQFGTDRPEAFSALFIDENLMSSGDTANPLLERIAKIFLTVFPKHRCSVDIIADEDGALPSTVENEKIGESIVEIDRFFEELLPQRIKSVILEPPLKVASEKGGPAKSLHSYDVIFCEIEYRSRYAGTQVVQKLASYLERRAFAEAVEDQRAKRPALIVLAHIDSISQIQECLNLGAHAWVNKERMYQIPSVVMRAVQNVQAEFADGGLVGREGLGQHSNFRSLYSLRPERTAALRNRDPKLRVIGGRKGPKGGPRSIPVWDDQDREWIRSLPKADLHCHFGTSISLQTIEALAFNTCGHLFINKSGAYSCLGNLNDPLYVVIKEICRIVKTAAKNRKDEHPAALKYLSAMLGRESDGPVNDPYGQIVSALMRKKPPIQEYFVTSLLVCASTFMRLGREATLAQVTKPWRYITELGAWCGCLRQEEEHLKQEKERLKQVEDRLSQIEWISGFIVRAAQLSIRGIDEVVLSIGPGLRVRFDRDQHIWKDMHRSPLPIASCQEFWHSWHKNISERIESTVQVLEHFLPNAPHRKAPSFEELVYLPEAPEPGDYRLLRYLWGAGLLGAEHLQHPENIILAAQDLITQNLDDSVTYTEVRCETPGYTRAGMGAENVTDLLCASFDIAELFQRTVNRRGFTRTNILLAAKRHKKEEEIEPVISLLAMYLKRKRPPLPFRIVGARAPSWWRPTEVVGFDLSGDESKQTEGLKQQISRLIELSSPITIHAGEAESAEKIWQAVYEYHARRIGHGVRLREKGQLLQFCINEGICMEMCPISNRFTSDFVQLEENDQYDPHRVEHYPLRYFMESGLEVCINTDNRSLHGRYGQTLTDEYLWAARLSGGFTRWQVLNLIKAGFKHAFIDKRDIHELLQGVENWMFALVANAPGLDWQPKHRLPAEEKVQSE